MERVDADTKVFFESKGYTLIENIKQKNGNYSTNYLISLQKHSLKRVVKIIPIRSELNISNILLEEVILEFI